MKKIFSSVWFRIAATAFSVVLQILLYILLFLRFYEYGKWFLLASTVISWVAIVKIILKDAVPEYKIAWIVPILVFPVFGGALFLIFGHSVLNKREKKKVSAIVSSYRNPGYADLSRLSRLEEIDPEAASQSRYLERFGASPCVDSTAVRYFPLGEEMFAAMLDDLNRAEKFIFLEYFIIAEGEMWSAIRSVLERKVAEGVEVRLMYDDLGCVFRLPANFAAQMEAKGIRCCAVNRFRHIFNSRFNNRDHRKICIVDGTVGYTGGINLADEYINRIEKHGHWKDTAVRLEGRGVAGLTAMFLAFWDFFYHSKTDPDEYLRALPAEGSGFVQPFSSIPGDGGNVGVNAYMNLVRRAKNYIYITTPYLIVDNTMISTLTLAARSGVDVRIITPGIPDKKTVFFLTRSYYRVLLNAGVRIFEYEPGFIHAKSVVSDDTTALVGTINLDYRSLYLHMESAVWMYGTDAVCDIKRDFLETQAVCREITPDSLEHMSPLRRMWLAFLRIFAPLM